MQYELQIAGDRYLFVSQQGNDTVFSCVSVCTFPEKAFFLFFYFLKQHLETVGKH